jgi:hypothetical protein
MIPHAALSNQTEDKLRYFLFLAYFILPDFLLHLFTEYEMVLYVYDTQDTVSGPMRLIIALNQRFTNCETRVVMEQRSIKATLWRPIRL